VKLAYKIFNRIRREIRHSVTYARARLFRTELRDEDIVEGWKNIGGVSSLQGCIEQWVSQRPRVFAKDLEQTWNSDQIFQEAEKIVKGPITIFQQPCGLRPPSLWHEDPLSHQSWPKTVHFTRFNVFHRSRDGVTDIRRLWEVGRFGWTLPLAQAFILKPKKDYPTAWSEYVTSFIKHNPPEYGPHWLNAMEVAIRAIQWCRALAVFVSYDKKSVFDPSSSILHYILPSLLSHGKYIRSHIEWTPYGRTNHYLADLVGLLTISTFIPQYKETAEWRRFALAGLVREIEIQTSSDGFHTEASTAYHHFVVELYTLVLLLDQQHHLGLSHRFYERVALMTRCDRTIQGFEHLNPRIGDDDSGTLHLGTPEILSPAYQSKLKDAPISRSCAFQPSGIYILRSNLISAIMSCGPNGQQGVGGHAHNDKLSLVVHTRGSPLIVDAGTCCYSANLTFRDQFRSTRSHNSIMVDEEEQNPLLDWRKLDDLTHAKCLGWNDSPYETFFTGEHRGYQRFGVIHRRGIQLKKNENILVVLDEFDARGMHTYDFFLHFHPSLTRDRFVLSSNHIRFPGGEILFKESFSFELINSVYSPIYGQQVSNLALHFRERKGGKWSLPWEIKLT
jgi:hypothetical protein